ncbi:MAG: DUF4412 domain-containing protein [Burkholderiales bacterium]|nr:DUF4412 domain-containing protein [Burkholderiales bacterium]
MSHLLTAAVAGLMTLSAMSAVWAVTLVESTDSDGVAQEVYFEGANMRAQERGGKEYMLFDMANRKMYAVNPEEREVLDLSGFLAQKSAQNRSTAKLDAKLARQGAGPTVAGYATEHYVSTANGRKCADEYLSKKAMADLRATMLSSERFWQLGKEFDSGMAGAALDPCDLAEAQIGRSYEKYGLPLRVIDADGSVSVEVTRIVKNAPLPAGGFSLPEGYAVVDMSRKMDEAMREAAKTMPPHGMGDKDVSPEELRRLIEQMQQQMKR